MYFHNHGNPGPGLYLPEGWAHNRAKFSANGTTLHDESYAASLRSLPVEGFYRVLEEFDCCDKSCRTFKSGTFVQLGYNRQGEGILFLPTLTEAGLTLPERGTRIEDDRFPKIEVLKVAHTPAVRAQVSPQVH